MLLRVLWEEVCGEQLQVPNKIKIFVACLTEPETGVHALWNCGLAEDVWASCTTRIQKCRGEYEDMVQLMEDLIVRLSTEA